MQTTRKQFLKQAGFALAGSLLPYSKLFAGINFGQKFTVDVNHPMYCSNNLRDHYLFSENKIRHNVSDDIFTYNKEVNDPLKDVLYSGDVGGCTSATAYDCTWSDGHDNKWASSTVPETTLKYKVSYPKSAIQKANGHDYQNVPLPCIILFHAGGFKECTPYDDDFMETLLYEFARKGFIAISVSYRTGRLADGDFSSAHEQLATYRGIQDARGAIRTIMRRNTSTGGFHNMTFKIDENQVFIGGASAGAAICMNVCYLRTQSMVNETFPVNSTSALTIEDALGPIDADYYDSDHTDELPIIRGILSCWGALRMPLKHGGQDVDADEPLFFLPDSDDVTNSQNPPVIAFHGKLDTTNIYPDDDEQYISNSTSNSRRKENDCLLEAENFIIKQPEMGPPAVNFFVKKGSGLNIYNILKDDRIDRFTLLYSDCNAGHGLKYSTDDYSSGFTDETNVTKYIAARTAVFCQAVMNYTSTSRVHPPANYTGSRSHFVDCLDSRICDEDAFPGSNDCTVTSCPEDL